MGRRHKEKGKRTRALKFIAVLFAPGLPVYFYGGIRERELASFKARMGLLEHKVRRPARPKILCKKATVDNADAEMLAEKVKHNRLKGKEGTRTNYLAVFPFGEDLLFLPFPRLNVGTSTRGRMNGL